MAKPIIANLERLNRLMRENGLDAIVARSGTNFTYLAGFAYPGTLARHLDLPDSPRGIYLIWPREGAPAIVLNAIAEGLTRRDSWIKRVEVYAGYTEPPVEKLVSVLKDMGLAGARVGFENGYISARDWAAIAARLPRMVMIDCTAMMDRVRWIKTPGEIALLKRAADLLDDAYLEVFPTIRDGEPESAVHSRLVASCIRRGANWAHGILNSSRNTIPYAGESQQPFLRGDAIRTDYVAYLDGYPGHQSRCAIMGEPTAEQSASYRKIRDIYRAACDRCRPGVLAGDVYAFVVQAFAKAGMKYHSMLAGHSVGCWWHQQEPVISRGNPIRLEEGMVIAMEPHVDHWHIQDMLVIEKDGPRLISDRFPTDLPYIVAL
ncbi:MAG TPA: Xaa-Pro peptidase family protein [Pseudorhodoplanes sp.]|nr:Xaa-Pro peptidase family protein [Pseudorhodoplanes sp.]